MNLSVARDDRAGGHSPGNDLACATGLFSALEPSSSGIVISARVMQDVPAGSSRLRAGAKVVGRVVEVKPGSAASPEGWRCAPIKS